MDIKNKFRSVILFGLASLVGGHFLSAISGSSTLIPVHEDENGRNRAFFWSCVDSESELPGCTICLGEFSDEDHVTYLNGCFHVFCRDCIANWFASKGENVCPLCKQICSEEDVINNFTYEEVVDSEKIFFGENLDAQDGEESSTDQEEVVPVKSRLQQDIEDGAERVLVGSYWKRVAREIEDLWNEDVTIKRSFESDEEQASYWRNVARDVDFHILDLSKKRLAEAHKRIISDEDKVYWEEAKKEINEYEVDLGREEKWKELFLLNDLLPLSRRERRDTV